MAENKRQTELDPAVAGNVGGDNDPRRFESTDR